MRLSRAEREVFNEIVDEALAWEGGDHPAVVAYVEAELMSLESQGHAWVVDLLGSCRWTGLSTRVRQRARAGRAAVGGESVPTCYVTGGTMTSWMHVPVADLDPVVERLEEQAETLLAHAHIVSQGQKLALEHNVSTAWQGFEAAGVTVVVAS
jgi:hypothetical protein